MGKNVTRTRTMYLERNQDDYGNSVGYGITWKREFMKTVYSWHVGTG
jgi:hypothetical protein